MLFDPVSICLLAMSQQFSLHYTYMNFYLTPPQLNKNKKLKK